MDLNYKLYLERADNELKLADIIFQVSDKKDLQKEILDIAQPETYFSSVITHSYYCIFYSAKAYLLKKGIKTRAPEEHKKTFEEFKKLVDQGIVDVELLKIYEKIMVRADTLLGIFSKEKFKRGKFTYHRLAQANYEPAKESLDRAELFFKNIYSLVS
ncbi:MAG: hypothetical protein ABIF40_00400 [archaeon]